MSYTVLARKWRPQSFTEMVGQEHVLKALINALDNQRLHHAYLFTGTRGVGKTTVARILAKCLNCESGITSKPCDDCGSCKEIYEGRSVDVLEIDAASRTKVEDTRELLENVQYLPTRSRFKIYLIDEVHMLSSHSFNALLKTLEEPPQHIKFLLATTDMQKLPATILSRCLQFTLKNMPEDQIVSHLKNLMDSEGVNFELSALQLLAHAGDGSMRDSLSLCDQAISYGSGQLLADEVRIMLGAVDREQVQDLLRLVAEENLPRCLELIENLATHGHDFESVLDELIRLIHAIAISQAVNDVDNSELVEGAYVDSLAPRITSDDLQLYYQTAINGKRDLKFAPDLRVGFEMIILRMIAFRPQIVIDDSLSVQDIHENSNEENSTTAHDKFPEEGGQGLSQNFASKSLPQDKWHEVLKDIDIAGIAGSVASHCAPKEISLDRIVFILDEKYSNLYKARHLDKIQLALRNYLGSEVSITIEPGVPTIETPAQRIVREKAECQEEAQQALAQDENLIGLLDRFDGKLDRDSISPLTDDSEACEND